jgi:hypothetical protein
MIIIKQLHFKVHDFIMYHTYKCSVALQQQDQELMNSVKSQNTCTGTEVHGYEMTNNTQILIILVLSTKSLIKHGQSIFIRITTVK